MWPCGTGGPGGSHFADPARPPISCGLPDPSQSLLGRPPALGPSSLFRKAPWGPVRGAAERFAVTKRPGKRSSWGWAAGSVNPGIARSGGGAREAARRRDVIGGRRAAPEAEGPGRGTRATCGASRAAVGPASQVGLRGATRRCAGGCARRTRCVPQPPSPVPAWPGPRPLCTGRAGASVFNPLDVPSPCLSCIPLPPSAQKPALGRLG